MIKKRIWGLFAAGVVSVVLAATLVLSVPTGVLAQDSDGATNSDAKTPPAQMKGTWTGSIDDVKNGTGTLTLDLTQVKATVGGTFNTDWSGQNSPSGSVHGEAQGNKVKLTLVATNQPHACKVSMIGEVLTLDELKGTYHSIIPSRHCKAQGTFDVFLQ